jgi:GST-like protein
MAEEYVVYGAAGTGSVPVEATLTLLGLPYRVVEAYGDDPALYAANPMRQVPALILPNGELMTESSAILVWLADSHPEARLSPTMAAHSRPAFLRWMAFVASAIYALYWIRDDPGRIIDDAELGKIAKARIADRFIACWKVMEAPAPASTTRRRSWPKSPAASTPTRACRRSGRRGFRSTRRPP